MIEKNVRMQPQLLDALDTAAINCKRNRSQAIRACIRKYANNGSNCNVQLKYPVKSGSEVITIQFKETMAELDGQYIRTAIAYVLSKLPVPNYYDIPEIQGIDYILKR